MRFTAGTEWLGQLLGLAIIVQSLSSVLTTYIALGVVAAIAQVAMCAVSRSLGDMVDFVDERDATIEARAKQVGYWVGIIAAHAIIVWTLSSAYTAKLRGSAAVLDFTSVTGLVCALLAVLFIQEVARNVAAVVLYRRDR